MSLQTRLSALITAIKTETKAIRTMISGTNNGDASSLATTATNLVGAINEIKVVADNAAAASEINDATQGATTTWSSNKIKTEITADIATALEGEDLSDLADAVAANAANDLNLTTLAQFNTLAATVANKADAADVYTQAELGDPETDLVAIWTAA